MVKCIMVQFGNKKWEIGNVKFRCTFIPKYHYIIITGTAVTQHGEIQSERKSIE